jgi:hypothetical protein
MQMERFPPPLASFVRDRRQFGVPPSLQQTPGRSRTRPAKSVAILHRRGPKYHDACMPDAEVMNVNRNVDRIRILAASAAAIILLVTACSRSQPTETSKEVAATAQPGSSSLLDGCSRPGDRHRPVLTLSVSESHERRSAGASRIPSDVERSHGLTLVPVLEDGPLTDVLQRLGK